MAYMPQRSFGKKKFRNLVLFSGSKGRMAEYELVNSWMWVFFGFVYMNVLNILIPLKQWNSFCQLFCAVNGRCWVSVLSSLPKKKNCKVFSDHLQSCVDTCFSFPYPGGSLPSFFPSLPVFLPSFRWRLHPFHFIPSLYSERSCDL